MITGVEALTWLAWHQWECTESEPLGEPSVEQRRLTAMDKELAAVEANVMDRTRELEGAADRELDELQRAAEEQLAKVAQLRTEVTDEMRRLREETTVSTSDLRQRLEPTVPSPSLPPSEDVER